MHSEPTARVGHETAQLVTQRGLADAGLANQQHQGATAADRRR
jgi:hypothetical protein